jgi:hypothetical protein
MLRGNCLACSEVELHLQVHGDAAAAIGKTVDAHNPADVFLIDGAVLGGIGVGDEQAHVLVVGVAIAGEVDARPANVQRIYNFVELLALRLGRPHAHFPRKFGAAFSPAFRSATQWIPLRLGDSLSRFDRRPSFRSGHEPGCAPFALRLGLRSELGLHFQFSPAQILRSPRFPRNLLCSIPTQLVSVTSAIALFVAMAIAHIAA